MYRVNGKICLVCSSGGHLFSMYLLQDAWSNYERIWITHKSTDTDYFLSNEKVYHAYYPTDRNLGNFFRNLYLAFKVLRKERPALILSTGAGVSVPFIYAGWILGIKTVFVETMTRVQDLSLSGKLIYPVVEFIYVQYPELAARYRKAQCKGQFV